MKSTQLVITTNHIFLYIFSVSFQGDKYWKFENTKKIYGPKSISVGFKGVPTGIDAAVVWSGNGKTYFFKGKNENNSLYKIYLQI